MLRVKVLPPVKGLFLVAALFWSNLNAAEWPEIMLSSELADTAQTVKTITVPKDPVYRSQKKYRAYPLRPVIQDLAKHYNGDLMQAVLVLTAIDGYKVSMTYTDAVEEDGYLAFNDVSAAPKKWTPFKFGDTEMTPAPFYLVWTKPNIDKWRYPWPFQLNTISIQPAEVYFGKAAPNSQEKIVKQGFAVFSRYCIRCHAVNDSGGKVGPELNAPQNITDLYGTEILTKLILNAPLYRKNTKMPVFKEILTTSQVDSILAYLKAMKSPLPQPNENK